MCRLLKAASNAEIERLKGCSHVSLSWSSKSDCIVTTGGLHPQNKWITPFPCTYHLSLSCPVFLQILLLINTTSPSFAQFFFWLFPPSTVRGQGELPVVIELCAPLTRNCVAPLTLITDEQDTPGPQILKNVWNCYPNNVPPQFQHC